VLEIVLVQFGRQMVKMVDQLSWHVLPFDSTVSGLNVNGLGLGRGVVNIRGLPNPLAISRIDGNLWICCHFRVVTTG
jgi:hypothetical protein